MSRADLSQQSERPLRQYLAACHDPESGISTMFQIKAMTPGSADSQARDGFFGLLGVDPKKRAALEVVLDDLGEVDGR